MKAVRSSVILFSMLVLLLSGPRTTHAFAGIRLADPPTGTYRFTNGQWFDGTGFRSQDFYSINGILTHKKPRAVDEVIDLKNGYVIPPFADAHTHNLDGTFNLDKMIKAYLAEGTFYVQVLANYASGAVAAKPSLNKPSSLDVIYANGGLTSTLGHPFLAYEPRALGYYDPAAVYRNMEKIKLSRLGERNVYWFFDSQTDVDANWEKYLAQKPDVVKIMLLDAENHEQLSKSGKAGETGLSPAVAEYVVRKAHAAGLRVYAHIETANDFRLGLKIGVDGFAHAPGYGWNGKINDAPKNDLTSMDIRLAAKKKVVVIPTAQIAIVSVTDYSDGKETLDPEALARVIERQRKLFGLMQSAGVVFAVGSDYFGRTLTGELDYLIENRIFDNRSLLRIAVESTPRSIFPKRKIGRLRPEYEASFLVLAGDPLENFAHVKNITLRVKQGVIIDSIVKQ